MSKFNDILTSVNRTAHKVGLKIKKHSPEILVVVGVAGVITSAVIACKATTKATDVIEEHKKEVDDIHFVAETKPEKYSEEDYQKDTVIVYTQTAVKLAKLYGPSVAIGAASIACIIGSHNILTKRNAALAAAYTAVDKTFKEYRNRVVDRFGKEVDKQLRYNIKAKEFEETTVDENGNEKTETITKDVAEIHSSDYAKFFDESCPGWTKDAEQNKYFLLCQQNYANEMLKAQGYLFLNDVYKLIGVPATRAGQIVGWVYDEKNPVGDNYVDFNIMDINSERARAFVNGYERSILLDFNVDGNILDLI